MNKFHLTGAFCAIFFSFITLPSQAALVSVLGGQAYYDDVADLTWLADATYAVTSGYAAANAIGAINSSPTNIQSNGKMGWEAAKTWAAGLDINGVTGWRLPVVPQPDSSCDFQLDPGGGFPIQGFGFDCTGSEMGNMFYNVLGGTAGDTISMTHNSNYDLFSNLKSAAYWSSTDYVPDNDPNLNMAAWNINFVNGQQNIDNNFNSRYAWAVHSGNVGAVPVPATVWLFGSGLIGLLRPVRRLINSRSIRRREKNFQSYPKKTGTTDRV